jgi:hypothetical protein
MGAENLAPTGIRSPDRQPVACRYTDYAIPAYIYMYIYIYTDPVLHTQMCINTYVHILTLPDVRSLKLRSIRHLILEN